MNKNLNPLFTGAIGVSLDNSLIQGNRLYFPDLPILRDKFITSIQLFNPDNDVRIPHTGKFVNTVLGDADFYITLCDIENTEFMSRFPLKNLDSAFRQVVINRQLVLQNCYIEIAEESALNNDAFYLVFFYRESFCRWRKCDDKGTTLQSVEIELDKTNTIGLFYFPDNRVLVDKSFRNIFTALSWQQDAKSPSGRVLINPEHAFITLIYKQNAVIDRVPLSVFYQEMKEFKLNAHFKVDFPSSFVEIAQGIYESADSSVLMTFEY